MKKIFLVPWSGVHVSETISHIISNKFCKRQTYLFLFHKTWPMNNNNNQVHFFDNCQCKRGS